MTHNRFLFRAYSDFFWYISFFLFGGFLSDLNSSHLIFSSHKCLMPRSAYYYVRQQYFCRNSARQTVLILYTIDASLCCCTSAVIYINGPQLGEVVRKENLVMDGRLNTHVAQGERNWYALWLWGEVGRGGGECHCFPFLFAFISKKVFLSALNILRRPWLMLMRFSSRLQVPISYSGWSRTWTSKIKVKTADQGSTRELGPVSNNTIHPFFFF